MLAVLLVEVKVKASISLKVTFIITVKWPLFMRIITVNIVKRQDCSKPSPCTAVVTLMVIHNLLRIFYDLILHTYTRCCIICWEGVITFPCVTVFIPSVVNLHIILHYLTVEPFSTCFYPAKKMAMEVVVSVSASKIYLRLTFFFRLIISDDKLKSDG